MRQPNPFLQLALPRVHTALASVESMIWQPVAEARCLAAPPTPNRVSLAQAKQDEDNMRPAPPDPSGADRLQFRWYRIDLPHDTDAEEAFLNWRHGGESTLYIDGRPYAGFDRQHAYHPLPTGAVEAWMEVMHMEAGQSLQGATICRRSRLAWKVHTDLEVLLDLTEMRCQHLREEYGSSYSDAFGYRPSPEYLDRPTRRLLRLLDDAVCTFENSGIRALSEDLDRILARFPADGLGCRLVATAQAHLDPVHMWPEAVGDFKVVHTFSSAARLMEEYPELTFQFSQPATYAMVQRKEPALMDAVHKRIDEGRWEMEGAMFVESDVQMPCGEALARAFLAGRKVTEQLTGRPSTVLWLPDTFGFPACLPQVMRQCGVEYFWTTKMHWNPITHFPYSSFRWEGHDGSVVYAHLAQHHMGYMLNGLPSQMRNVERIHRQADVHEESIAPIGFGDGGGGITACQVERVRRIADLHGVPRTEFGRVRDFFERMKAKRDRLPRFQGELYLEYHRGVLTSRRRIKELYRACERELQRLEAAHAALGLGPVPERFWERVAFMQFHDILTGSHVEEPYREVCEEMESMVAELGEATSRALSAEDTDARPCLFNPLPIPRRWVEQDGTGQATLVELPPLAGVDLQAPACQVAAPEVAADEHHLANDRLRAEFDDFGRISALQMDGRSVRLQGAANELIVYREMPTMFDVWNIDRQSLSGGTPAGGAESARVLGSGPCRKSVEFVRSLGDAGSVCVTYTLEAASTALRIRYEIDWRAPRSMLKAHFPTTYRAPDGRFGTPFGSVLRSAQPGMPHEEAMWESAGSRWACVFDEGERDGLYLVTRDSYGFACYDGDLNVTLLRSPMPPEVDRKRLGAVLVQDADAYGEATDEDVFTDLGKQTVQIAVGLYDSDAPRGELPPALAETLYTAPVPYRGHPVETAVPLFQGGSHMLPCWVEPRPEGGMVVRLHETLGRHGMTQCAGAQGDHALVDLSGRVVGQAQAGRVEFGPYQVLGCVFR